CSSNNRVQPTLSTHSLAAPQTPWPERWTACHSLELFPSRRDRGRRFGSRKASEHVLTLVCRVTKQLDNAECIYIALVDEGRK
ncbi:uncharacterized, partial [Tachysurus ichikawai]